MHQSGRQQNFKKSYFSLNIVGMPYIGLPVDQKFNLWHTICRPVLTFGLETVYLIRAMHGKLESLQGTIVKASEQENLHSFKKCSKTFISFYSLVSQYFLHNILP